MWQVRCDTGVAWRRLNCSVGSVGAMSSTVWHVRVWNVWGFAKTMEVQWLQRQVPWACLPLSFSHVPASFILCCPIPCWVLALQAGLRAAAALLPTPSSCLPHAPDFHALAWSLLPADRRPPSWAKCCITHLIHSCLPLHAPDTCSRTDMLPCTCRWVLSKLGVVFSSPTACSHAPDPHAVYLLSLVSADGCTSS